MAVTILDGPLGTELLARGVPTPLPGWSAHALETAPETVAAIHRDYAIAGATVLTANTFRTKRRVLPDRWEALAREAVRIARAEAPADGRVAGSIAPLEDCYRPDLSPADGDPDACRAEHAELAAVLADAGCDLLLCETHPHVGEALLAVEAAVATGVETWLALSPGYRADLLSPDELARAAVQAVERGARAVLVNCVPAAAALGFVRALVDAAGGAPVGCYANGGSPDAVMGWTSSPPAVEDYAELAAEWIRAGAEIVGGCCGTGPPHVARLAARFRD
ncbi:MAG: homocysteine S-methyltransferase family protein [Planctomycetota bacterium]|nr:homocysteine S-methyltransferase family protein [Planctomycetota bacterium]